MPEGAVRTPDREVRPRLQERHSSPVPQYQPARVPIFSRLDLLVTSDRESPRKHPDPFPEWSVATSAFWNVVWAVKYHKRGKPEVADEYMAAACDKLRTDPVGFSDDAVRTLLARLAATGDVDAELIAKLRAEMPAGPS